jgi:hypothetical protein
MERSDHLFIERDAVLCSVRIERIFFINKKSGEIFLDSNRVLLQSIVRYETVKTDNTMSARRKKRSIIPFLNSTLCRRTVPDSFSSQL